MTDVQLWDTKEWKALEQPHHRLFDFGDDVTVDRITVLDNIVVLCTGCAHDDADCIEDVAKTVRAIQGIVDASVTTTAAPPVPRLRCDQCPGGGEVVEAQYTNVCRRCGQVAEETRVQSVNAFRNFSDAADRSHHGTLVDQRALDAGPQPSSKTKRRSLMRNIIRPVCHSLQLLDAVADEALMDCELYLDTHPRTQLKARDRRAAKRLAAASIVRAMLQIYLRDYEMDPMLHVPRRRLYNTMDVVFPTMLLPASSKESN